MSHTAFMAKAGALCAAAILIGVSPAPAHTIVGNRVFPATLTIDDPGVNDELALPSFAYMAGRQLRRNARADLLYARLGIRENDHGGSRIFGRLGRLHMAEESRAPQGWANIETQLKYVFYQNPEHEFIIAGRAQCGMGEHRQPAEFIAAVRSAYDGHAESLYRQGVRRRSTSIGRGPSR